MRRARPHRRRRGAAPGRPISSRAERAPGVEELRAHLAQKLPEYMVPAAFVFLDGFPLTVNGKLDRDALPAPGSERPHLASEYVAPQSELEKMLADFGKTALRQDQVSVNDNFFDLGADSLMLTTRPSPACRPS